VTPAPQSALSWEGQTLLDRAGEKIGTIQEIFLVEQTGRPEWALVKLGRLKTHTTLVPLISAQAIDDAVKVGLDKEIVGGAPEIDAEGEPSEQPDGIGAAAGRLGEVGPSAEDVAQKAQAAASTAAEHPIAVAAGAIAAGLAAGLALPETEVERQKLAPAAQQAREQVESRARETIEQVKSAAKDAADSTIEAVRQEGRQHAGKVGELADKAAEKAQENVNAER
jgi:PRC-barrel domain